MAKILLVEDQFTNVEVATVICSAAGHAVTVANNGLEALALLERETFDLVLMDVQMPQMDGIEATRAIRRQPALAGLPIIGLTAMVDRQDHQAMLAVGINRILLKPYRNRQLLAAIDDALASPELSMLVARPAHAIDRAQATA